jgi:REP element-mobilizing transposase RayT
VNLVRTTRFYRGKLPHWEVEAGRYFVTVRLADSLPREVVLQLQEIHQNLSAIEPKTEQFAALQRTYFRSMEKYLDAGTGACWLKRADIAEFIVRELAALHEWHVEVPHHTIMPNHWHALLLPLPQCKQSLSAILKRVKGRTAKHIRRAIGGSGSIWQREWFDRWMRDDAEWSKTVGLYSAESGESWTRRSL